MPLSETPRFDKLNVVFHGTFLFWKRPKEEKLEVLIPFVDMHAYYAGNWQRGKLEWLDELDEKKNVGVYELRNVHGTKGARPGFDKKDNVIVKPPPRENAPKVRKITLPLHADVKTLQHLQLQKNNFDGPRQLLAELEKANLVNVPESLGLIHVLTYDVDKGKEPELKGSHWKPIPSKTNPRVANLHLFADPPSQLSMKGMTMKHPEEAFRALMSLMPATFPGRHFDFHYPAKEIPLIEPDHDDDIPKGLRRIELISLAISNLLDESQIASHGVTAKGRMPMAGRAGAAKMPANQMSKMTMTMNPDDVGCHPPYNCSSGCSGC